MRLLIGESGVSEGGPIEPGTTRSFAVVPLDLPTRLRFDAVVADTTILAAVTHVVADGYEDARERVSGVVEQIHVIEARYATNTGRPQPGSGSIRAVARAVGLTGDTDSGEPVPIAFVLDMRRL